jgi:hypothetical protein
MQVEEEDEEEEDEEEEIEEPPAPSSDTYVSEVALPKFISLNPLFSRYGSKLREITLTILRIKKKDPSAKILVFTSWDSLKRILDFEMSKGIRIPIPILIQKQKIEMDFNMGLLKA